MFVAYSVYFHPLRKYPGPWYLTISSIPNRWSTISGNSSYWLFNLHDRYGPIVRVAPNEVSYSDPQAWLDIYGPQPDERLGMPKDPKFFSSFEDKHTAASIITSQPKDYMRMRHIYSYGFSKKVMLAKEPIIQGVIDRAMESLRETQHSPKDIVETLRATDFSIVTEIVFGKPFHIFDKETYQPWARSLMGWIRSTAVVTATTDYPLGKLAARFLTPCSVRKQRDIYLKYVTEEINDRLNQKNSGRMDVVQLIFDMSDHASIAESDVKANLPFMVIAASETTTTLMSGLVAHLLNSHEALGQLTAEVRSQFTHASDITIAAVSNLPFLNACVKEVLRVYPAAPTQLPRIVPGDGAVICGKWVPGGTKVYVAPYATFRSRENFYQPDVFLPERWLPGKADSFEADKNNAWRPFGLGAHECPGQV
jgi:cytochrome P450